MYRLKNRKVQAQFTVCHKMFGPGKDLGRSNLHGWRGYGPDIRWQAVTGRYGSGTEHGRYEFTLSAGRAQGGERTHTGGVISTTTQCLSVFENLPSSPLRH